MSLLSSSPRIALRSLAGAVVLGVALAVPGAGQDLSPAAAGAPAPGTTEVPRPSPDVPVPLEGVTWVLREVEGVTVAPADPAVTLTLDGSLATLAQACATSSIAYSLDRSLPASGRLAFDAAAAACPAGASTGPGVAELLMRVAGYDIGADVLTLHDAADVPLLVFELPPLSSLEGAWEVTAYDPWGEGLVLPLEGSPLRVAFEPDGRVEVTTGCRGFAGGYAVSGETLTIGVQSLAQLDCPQPRYEEEIALSVALQSSLAWSGTGARLELRDDLDRPRVLLRTRPQLSIVGGWRVERHAGQGGRVREPVGGTGPTVAFAPDETLAGETGCRPFKGGYFTDGDRVAIGPLEPAGEPCADALRRQERQVLHALEAAVTWVREGARLRLRGADGSLLVELALVEPAALASPDPAGDAAGPPDAAGTPTS